MSLVNFV
jgi:glyoxylase-like metal-dependent hydrolase (beta-lactamase superfamily II)